MQGIKILQMNFNDVNRDNTLTVADNQAYAEYATDRDSWTKYISNGTASDAYEITFQVESLASRTADTLILINHNFKAFTYDYYTGTGNVWTNVVTETANTGTTYYKKHSSFTATKWRLVIGTTIVSNALKEMEEFITTKEIGQFEHPPKISFSNDKNATKKTMINGKEKVLYARDSHSIELEFKSYTSNADRNLFRTIWNTYDPFLVWLCGSDGTQFAFADEGYRYKDIYLCSIDKNYKHQYTNNLYSAGMNLKINLIEVV